MFEQLMIMVKALEQVGDVFYYVTESTKMLHLIFNDFEGFDEDWSEIFRDYEDELGVEILLQWLEDHCQEREGDFYTVYHFDGFDVEVGYTSYDI